MAILMGCLFEPTQLSKFRLIQGPRFADAVQLVANKYNDGDHSLDIFVWQRTNRYFLFSLKIYHQLPCNEMVWSFQDVVCGPHHSINQGATYLQFVIGFLLQFEKIVSTFLSRPIFAQTLFWGEKGVFVKISRTAESQPFTP